MPQSTRPQIRTSNDPQGYTDVGKAANGGVPMPVELSGLDIEIGAVEIKDATTDTRAVVSSKGLEVFDQVANSLVPAKFDFVDLTWTSSNLTQAVFKTGGSGGSTVATIAMTYDGDNNLLTVTST